MKKYERGDIVTFYFVTATNGVDTRIQGWTDEKDLAKYYMDFHKCNNFKLKMITNTIEHISSILEENVHDEIKIFNIKIRNRNRKKNDLEFKLIQAPLTDTEHTFIEEEINTFMGSRIEYWTINQAIPYLKKKYRIALRDILLLDVINRVIHERNPKVLEGVELDQLLMLFRSFPDFFGK